jgi:hypothetical protein
MIYGLQPDLTSTVSQQITRFQMDQSYAPMNTSEFFTDEVLNKWNALMPGEWVA